MRRFIVATLGLMAVAYPAQAQNDMAPVLGHDDEAPARVSRTVSFTALGTYGEQAQQRIIDVRADADTDGDGAKDQGVLRIACNGGDILSGSFVVGGSVSASKPKKLVRAQGASPLAAGRSFKVSWDAVAVAKASATSSPVPLTIRGGPDLCA